jgi:uncharacterized protein with von Willebrand factor type A (vWA) domain
MDDATSGVSSVIEPLAVGSLLSALQESGWKIGVDQHLRARQLLILLAEEGPLTRDTVRDSIAPIVCCTADDQRTFDSVFQRWFSEREAKPIEPDDAPPHRTTPEELQRRPFRAVRWVAAAFVAFLAVRFCSFVFDSSGGGGEPAPTPFSWFAFLAGLVGTPFRFVMASLLAAAAIVAFRRRTRVLALRRDEAEAGDLEERLLRVGAKTASPADLRMLSRRLQVRKPSEAEEIDVRRTILASARTAGWLTVVKRPLHFTPEYVALIDRASARDHLASYYDSIMDALLDADVPVAVYEFHRDPRVVWKRSGPRRLIPLGDIERQHYNARVLLFSDAAGLLDPYSAQAYSWTHIFTAWREKYILPPPGVAAQTRRMDALRERGFAIVAADSFGLATIGEIFASEPGRQRPRSIRPVPLILERERVRWLDRRDPPEELKASLLAVLREYLGPGGFDWLCACAVYPSIEWRLTTYLGSALGLIDDNRSTVASLAHLPWFRHGSMPDWLRALLIPQLTPARESEVRTALDTLLNGALEETRGGFALPVARQGPWSRLRRRLLLRDLRAAQPVGSALSDRVLLEFLSGPKEDPLTVRVPRALLEVFKRKPGPQPVEKSQPPLTRKRAYAMVVIYLLPPLSVVVRLFGHRNPELRWHSSNSIALVFPVFFYYAVSWLLSDTFALFSCALSLAILVPQVYLVGAIIAAFIDGIYGRRLHVWWFGRGADWLAALGTGAPPESEVRQRLPWGRRILVLSSYWFILPFVWRVLTTEKELRWHASQGIVVNLAALVLGVLSVSGAWGTESTASLTIVAAICGLYYLVIASCAATIFAFHGRRLHIWPFRRLINAIAGEGHLPRFRGSMQA